MQKLFSLAGKNALVTGSARGLGNVIARGLLDAGATVILNDVSEDALKGAAAEFGAVGYDTPTCAFDITDEAQVLRAVSAIERKHPLDILINNAGIHLRDPLIDMPVGNFRKVVDVNLTGAFVVGRAAARGMIARGGGKIVNISSINALMVRPGIGNYCAAKGGLGTLTKSMATEWGAHNITVNAIGPGYFLTEMTAALAQDPGFDAWVKSEVPLKRWGKPEDIVGLVVLLSSAASDYISGQTIYIDGGWQACL